MEAVYRKRDGKRLILYDEENQIFVSELGRSHTMRRGILCRDYGSCGISAQWMDEIYVAYMNMEYALVWDKLFAQERITLAAGEVFGSITNVKIAELLGEKNEIYVFYQKTERKTGTDMLYVISPLGERKVQMLLQSEKRIEHYEIVQHGGVSYLIYKLQSEHKPRIFAVDVSRLGDISLTEYILCKEKTMQELEIRCKENDRNYQKAIKGKQQEYEDRLKEKVKDIEQRYKKQYNELAQLAKGMQEEGRKWQELYYKSVTKN
ncbi:MAG: hypothetical protein ACI4L2_07635 [Wujia sp.]